MNHSAKRVSILVSCIEAKCPESSKQRLKNLCATRWVERHEAVLTFVALYAAILECFERCMQLDSETATKARMLSKAMKSSEFLVALVCLENLLSVTYSLSKQLQQVGIDLFKSKDLIDDVTRTLQQKRDKAELEFNTLLIKASKLAAYSESDIKLPRITEMQKSRVNVPHATPNEYFCRAIYIPLLDHILADLCERFSQHSLIVMRFSAVIPAFVSEYSFSDILPVVHEYIDFLPAISTSMIEGEFDVWKERWCNVPISDRPSTAIDSLQKCKETEFPCLRVILQIAATLPVTTASAERSFSTLKRLKTYLRTNMTQERLCGLALLHIHQDIPLTASEVIDRFANTTHRMLL